MQGCVWKVPRPREVGAPRPSAAKVGATRSGRIPPPSVSGPWRLHMRDGFLRRNHDPPLKCSDSSPQQTLLQYSCSAVVHYLIASTPLPTASTLCGTILGPNYCLLRPSHLDCDCLSLLASLCALPSSLLGPDPFLYHPALLGPNHLSSLFSFPSSLAVALFPDPTSRMPLRSVYQAIDCAPNCLDRLRHHSGTEILPSSALSS